MAKGKVKEALDAAASFKARGIKKAALAVVAEYEHKCPDCGQGLDLDHAGCKGVEHDDKNGGWKVKKQAAVCRTCHRGPTDPADTASPADYAKNPKAYCPECKTPNLKGDASFRQHGPKTAAPGDPNQPPIQRDEPAAQADPPIPAPEAQPVQPVAPAPEPVEEEPEEVEVEESQEAKVARWREELDTELGDDDLVTAVIEFFEAESVDLDDYGTKVTLGNSGEANVEYGKNRSFVVCKSDDEAEAIAIAQVTQDLEQEPELFNRDWLENYIDTEKLSDSLYDDVYNWVYEEPKSYGWDPDDVYETDDEGNYLDEDGNVVEDTDTPSDEWIEAKAREQVADPMEFLGQMYGKDELLKEAIRIAGIDIEEAATDAVAADGWQHFLSRYDGNSYDLPSGGVYCCDLNHDYAFN